MANIGSTLGGCGRRIERFLRWRLAAPAAEWLERALNVTVFAKSHWVQRLTGPLRLARRPLLLVRSGLDLSASVIRGQDEDGVPRSVLYAGEREAREWILRRLLPAERKEEPTVRVRPWELRRLVDRHRSEVDLIVLELNRWLRPVPPGDPVQEFPRWVRMWIRLEKTWDSMLSRFGRSARKQIRRIQSERLEYRVVPAGEVFEEFHDRYYIPFVHARHGDLVILHDRRELEEFARRGSIIQVLDGERWVAGMLNAVRGRDVRCIVLGVLDADPELIRRNVLKALFYFTIRWAVEQNLRSIDVGRVRPVEDDPVLIQKRRWDACVEPDPWEESRCLIVPGASADFFEAIRHRHAFIAGP